MTISVVSLVKKILFIKNFAVGTERSVRLITRFHPACKVRFAKLGYLVTAQGYYIF